MTTRMTGLVENLLLLARTDSNSLKIQYEVVNISMLFKNAFSSFQHLAEKNNITLINNATQPLEVFGDKKLLATLISILMDNAIKYTKEHGAIIVTSKSSIYKNKKMIEFSVEDTGIGIPQEELKHIFDRFYRVETSRSKRTGSYGLGLSIAKEIIESHHGHILVTSQLEQGSQFKVQMPSI